MSSDVLLSAVDTKGDFGEEGRNPFIPIEGIDDGTGKVIR